LSNPSGDRGSKLETAIADGGRFRDLLLPGIAPVAFWTHFIKLLIGDFVEGRGPRALLDTKRNAAKPGWWRLSLTTVEGGARRVFRCMHWRIVAKPKTFRPLKWQQMISKTHQIDKFGNLSMRFVSVGLSVPPSLALSTWRSSCMLSNHNSPHFTTRYPEITDAEL